jgi:glycerol-3-phosphate O-acyltransferase
LPDTYNLTSLGFRKLKLFAAFLSAYFESYWVVLDFFKHSPRETMDSGDRIKKIQAIGTRMFKKKEISRSEALSQINYKNAVDFFLSQGIKGSEDEEKIEHFRKAVARYMELLQS